MPASSLSLNPTPPCLGCGRNLLRSTVPCLQASRADGINQTVLRFSSSAVLFVGLSLGVFSSASARIPPPVVSSQSVTFDQQDEETLRVEVKHEDQREFEDEESKAAFEAYKSKVYALSVPLNLVALRGSMPPSWNKDFVNSQGKRVKFQPKFRASLEEIFADLCAPMVKGKIRPASAVAADIISIGDSWLSCAITRVIIEPIKKLDDQNWYRDLSDKWKIYLRRNTAGKRDPEGELWAVPYRWGSMVIAYKKSKFQENKLDPVKDWSDLWRPELAGRISMVNSPREVIGAVLKYMGASYNTENIDLHVPGGMKAVEKNLASLVKQVRLFDSTHYLKAFSVGDVWVAVGWSSDVLPVVKRMSNVAVIVPESGSSLWADLWAIPTGSRLETDQIGGRVRGPSPLIHQWLEFCLQPARSLPFIQEVIPGSNPTTLDDPLIKSPDDLGKCKPRLDTNLVAGVPPAEIMSKCEFLEPLSESALLEYQTLIRNLQQQPGHGLTDRLLVKILEMVQSKR